MQQLVRDLYQQRSKDSRLASGLTLLELPNLMALLDWLELELQVNPSTAESVFTTAGIIERLLANLNRPQVQRRARAIRERAAAAMPEWGLVQFSNQQSQIERLLGQGKLKAACDQDALLQKAQSVGPTAYLGADSDLAIAHFMLGQVLRMDNQTVPALKLLVTAQQLFEALGERGARMADVALTEQADCLRADGQLEAAAEKYKDAISRSETRNDSRQVAVGKAQLATIRMHQGWYDEAISMYEATRTLFAQQGEDQSVAKAWYHIGEVYEETEQYDAAEDAYRQSLKIETLTKNRAGEAITLGRIGNLYQKQKRLGEAMTFYRQALNIQVELGNSSGEATQRNNIADTLRQLQQYDEAREEIRRVIECKQPSSHVATPWTSFAILHEIETASDNPAAAREAWQHARDAYLAYRQQGGYARYFGGNLVDHVLGLPAQQQVEEVQSLLVKLTNDPRVSDARKQLIQAIVAILNGSRDPALADDPALDGVDAAEVLFLIERLTHPFP
jgi:tetratricopeptide (TPR) repeat protein